MKRKSHLTNLVLISLFLIVFISIFNSFYMIKELHKNLKDDACIINRLGQIRGDTQRYVKLKIAKGNYKIVEKEICKNFKIVKKVSKTVFPLIYQKEFYKNFKNLHALWEEIKKENNKNNLILLSENHWKIADKTTTFAQKISEIKLNNILKKIRLITIVSIFLMLIIIFIIYFYVKKGLEKENITDPLTGLYNRRYFDSIIHNFIAFSKRYNLPLSLAILDIDYFKKINDTYGHPKGDEVLKEFSKIIIDNIRKSDFAFRYGGEEIAILFPQTKKEEAFKVIQKLNKLIKEKIQIDNKPITFSAGVTQLKLYEDKYSFIKRADNLVYKAKENGRNRIEID